VQRCSPPLHPVPGPKNVSRWLSPSHEGSISGQGGTGAPWQGDAGVFCSGHGEMDLKLHGVLAMEGLRVGEGEGQQLVWGHSASPIPALQAPA